MKKLGRIMMILAAPAAILYGLKEIGGSPLYKGDDVGFVWRVSSNPSRLVLTNDVGDITCLLRLKLASRSTAYDAQLANQTVIPVNNISNNGEEGWLELSAVSLASQDKFKWPSGTGIFIVPKSGTVSDLRVK